MTERDVIPIAFPAAMTHSYKNISIRIQHYLTFPSQIRIRKYRIGFLWTLRAFPCVTKPHQKTRWKIVETRLET